jgi:hypothetical protein
MDLSEKIMLCSDEMLRDFFIHSHIFDSFIEVVNFITRKDGLAYRGIHVETGRKRQY